MKIRTPLRSHAVDKFKSEKRKTYTNVYFFPKSLSEHSKTYIIPTRSRRHQPFEPAVILQF